MIEYLIVVGSIMAQSISFCISYRVYFNQECTQKKHRMITYACLMLIIHGMLCFMLSPKESYDWTMITQVLIPIILIEDRRLEKYLQYCFISIATPMIGIVIVYAIAVEKAKPIYLFLDSVAWILVVEVNVLVIMMIIYAIERKKLKNKNTKVSIIGHIAMLAVGISSLLLISCVQEISRIYKGELIEIIGLSTSVACIVPIIVVIWLLQSEQTRNELEVRNRLGHELLIMQKNYSERIINNNKQIRKFRHDFKGHVQVLQRYCNEREYNKLEEYLAILTEESKINNDKYTGNMEIDAIISVLVDRCRERGIKLDINGFLPKDFAEKNIYDICVLVSNLINNAVEECERQLSSNPWIKIEMADYNGLLRIFIENKSSHKKDVKNLKTEKGDSINHGLGIKNIRRVVDKYGGEINIKSTNETFCVEVFI